MLTILANFTTIYLFNLNIYIYLIINPKINFLNFVAHFIYLIFVEEEEKEEKQQQQQ